VGVILLRFTNPFNHAVTSVLFQVITDKPTWIGGKSMEAGSLHRRRLCIAAFLAFIMVVVGSNNAVASKQRVLEVWSMFSEGEPMQEWTAEVIKGFEDTTGIKVKVVWAGRQVLTKARPRILTGQVPDVIDQSNAELLTLINEGLAYQLDEALDGKAWDQNAKWRDTFSSSVLELTRFDGKTFVIPRTIYTSGFFYNIDMFEKYQLNPPKNWTEFLDVCETLKRNGIEPLSADGTISFYNVWYFSWLAMRIAGPDKLKAAAEGKISWNDPDFLKAAKMVRDLIDKGYLMKGYEGSVWPASQMDWVQGRTAMLLCGGWIPSEMSKSKPEDFRMNIFPFPTVQDSKVDQTITEGWSDSWMIFKDAKNKDEAIEFLKFSTSLNAVNRMTAIMNPSPVLDSKPVDGLVGQTEIFSKASRVVDKHSGLEMMPEYYQVVYQKIGDKLFLGRVSPEEFIKELEQATKEFYARKK
jgi:raffinose/stachyose/melibiose transport system substrate-binding protein